MFIFDVDIDGSTKPMMVFVSAPVGELVYSVVSLFREDERNRKDRERVCSFWCKFGSCRFEYKFVVYSCF